MSAFTEFKRDMYTVFHNTITEIKNFKPLALCNWLS